MVEQKTRKDKNARNRSIRTAAVAAVLATTLALGLRNSNADTPVHDARSVSTAVQYTGGFTAFDLKKVPNVREEGLSEKDPRPADMGYVKGSSYYCWVTSSGNVVNMAPIKSGAEYEATREILIKKNAGFPPLWLRYTWQTSIKPTLPAVEISQRLIDDNILGAGLGLAIQNNAYPVIMPMLTIKKANPPISTKHAKILQHADMYAKTVFSENYSGYELRMPAGMYQQLYLNDLYARMRLQATTHEGAGPALDPPTAPTVIGIEINGMGGGMFQAVVNILPLMIPEHGAFTQEFMANIKDVRTADMNELKLQQRMPTLTSWSGSSLSKWTGYATLSMKQGQSGLWDVSLNGTRWNNVKLPDRIKSVRMVYESTVVPLTYARKAVRAPHTFSEFIKRLTPSDKYKIMHDHAYNGAYLHMGINDIFVSVPKYDVTLVPKELSHEKSRAGFETVRLEFSKDQTSRPELDRIIMAGIPGPIHADTSPSSTEKYVEDLVVPELISNQYDANHYIYRADFKILRHDNDPATHLKNAVR